MQRQEGTQAQAPPKESLEARQKVGGELRESIVACSHDYDAIIGAREFDEAIRAHGAFRNVLGVATEGADALYDVGAADASVGGAAIIDRIGHDEDVVG